MVLAVTVVTTAAGHAASTGQCDTASATAIAPRVFVTSDSSCPNGTFYRFSAKLGTVARLQIIRDDGVQNDIARLMGPNSDGNAAGLEACSIHGESEPSDRFEWECGIPKTAPYFLKVIAHDRIRVLLDTPRGRVGPPGACSIATASFVTLGTTSYGNGDYCSADGTQKQYFRFRLRQPRSLSLVTHWFGTGGSGISNPWVGIYPPGTNIFNINNRHTVCDSLTGLNQARELTPCKLRKSGVYIVQAEGPFKFALVGLR
jgi:hypothetical protein